MTLRRRFTGLSLVAGLLFFHAAAALANPYEVGDVRVDETAETATKAKEKALAAAESQAYAKLIGRLTLSEDQARLPRPGHAELAALISDFGVVEEKSSSVRYIARLVFRFKTDAVRKLLRDHGVAFAETESKPRVVLPLFQGKAPMVLWDNPNPWRDAWQALPGRDGLVPLVVPLGDLTDVSAASANQVARGELQPLNTIAARYEAGGTVVPRAVLKTDARTGLPVLDVTLAHYNATGLVSSTPVTVAAQPREDVDALLRRAASDLARRIEDEWKRANVLSLDSMGLTPATVPVSGLKDWLDVRRKLEGVALVRKIEVIQMSRDEVRIALHHLGDAQQLTVALRQSDLAFALEGEQWVLRSTTTRIPMGGGGGGTTVVPMR
jgi:hypothetical protein